jgi:hypothetical protein
MLLRILATSASQSPGHIFLPAIGAGRRSTVAFGLPRGIEIQGHDSQINRSFEGRVEPSGSGVLTVQL